MQTFNEWIINEVKNDKKIRLKLPANAQKIFKIEGERRYNSEHKLINFQKPNGWKIENVREIKEAIKLLIDAGNDPSKLEYEKTLSGDSYFIYYANEYVAYYGSSSKTLNLKEEYFE